MEFVFTELGYFTKNYAQRIKEVMDGKTFMKFKVYYSNFAGNCTLIVDTDYYKEDIMNGTMTYEEAEKEVKGMFLHAAMCEIARS